VLEDPAGLQELQALGARSVPVVSKNGRFVFAQLIKDVVEFLGLDEDVGPKLSPETLVERGDAIWTAAIRYCRQMPEAALSKELPNRPRSYRVLLHHVFQIPNAFLIARRDGSALDQKTLVAPPPDEIVDVEDIARFGEDIRQDFARWAEAEGETLGRDRMATYYGEQPTHEVLERTIWHSAQHVRQIMSLLEREGVAIDRPLAPEVLAGLPLPGPVWDS